MNIIQLRPYIVKHAYLHITSTTDPNQTTPTQPNQPTPGNRVLLQKLIVTQLVTKFPTLYGTPKAHYHVHKSLQLHPILFQINLVHNFPSISLGSILILLVCIFHISHVCYIHKWPKKFKVGEEEFRSWLGQSHHIITPDCIAVEEC
jgi:hypothetical protein